jgi:AI-2 transport protein TqsA
VDTIQHEQRIQTVCLLLLTTVVVAIALWWLRPVMIPFVLASFFAFALTPLIDFQRRYLWVPRPLAILITMIFGFVVLSLLGGLITISVRQLSANADVYQQKINQMLDYAMAMIEHFGFDPVTIFSSFSALPIKTVGGLLVTTTNAIVELLSQGLLMMIFLFFLLLGGGTRTQPSTGVWSEVETRIKRYIITKILVSAVTGVLVGSILTLLNINLALVFGLFTFLLNFIPSIGSIIATLLPLPIVLLSPDVSLTVAVLAIGIPALLHFVIGNVLEPKVMGGSLDLHPVTILLTLIVWGMLWGLVGMLLAIPLTSVMKILCERIELTAPVGELLAGRFNGSRVSK